ncbi:MAG: drug/metabolite exporter YedA [Ignavibacteriales bacterium]|nr:drug/metabolite exporter YedA [Ignavibacteriales bacterium]
MQPPPSQMKLLAAFASVYLIWGSTYLGIRFAIETIPPLLMAGIRFIIAGSLLYLWGVFRGHERPTFAHWKSTAIIGLMLLLVGNGGLSWSEQLIPSGVAALLVAVSPLWFILLEWMQGGVKPTAGVFLGLFLGTFGVVVLIDPANLVGGMSINILGALVLLGSSICWAVGSLYSRRAKLPSSPALANGMEMLIGGVGLLVVSAVIGEWSLFHPADITTRSLLAVGYLIVFGSIIGFSSYVWLLRSTTPARASTYAYVNPIVAVIIGWLVAGETLSGRVLIAAALIIAAVAAITTLGTKKSSQVLETLKEWKEERKRETENEK